MTKTLDRVASIAQSENLGEMLLQTKPSRKDSARSIFIGLLCTSPGLLLLFIALTAERDASSTGADWIQWFAIAWVVLGFIVAAGFIVSAFQKSQHQILLYEQGLVELQGDKICAAKYEDLQIYHNSVQISAYGVIPITQAGDYIVEFPDGRRSQIDWNQGKRPVGEMIQDLIYQFQLPKAIARLDQGQELVFGPVRLNSQSLTIKEKTVFWLEIERIQLSKGSFYILQRGNLRSLANIEFGKVPNAWVFLGLLQRLGKYN